MGTEDILKQLLTDAQRRASELELPELYYSIEDAAKILEISRSKMYKIVQDKEYEIAVLVFDSDRRGYVLSEDIRRLFVVLHTPNLKRQGCKLRPPFRAQNAPIVAPINLPSKNGR